MILLTAIRTVLLDYCIDTFYKKIKTNFSIHDESDLKYLQDCYNLLCKIHEISEEDIDITFEIYCIMYYDSLNTHGREYTYGFDSIFNKERLEFIYQQILNSDGEIGYVLGTIDDDFDDDEFGDF